MPALVENLSFKQVTAVEVGLEYALALGIDFDENGRPLTKIPPP